MDGTYRQTIHISRPPKALEYQSGWQRWQYEAQPNGTGYLSLAGYRSCAITSAASCDFVNNGQYPEADVCAGDDIRPNPIGGSVLVVTGVSPQALDWYPRKVVLNRFEGFESSSWDYLKETH